MDEVSLQPFQIVALCYYFYCISCKRNGKQRFWVHPIKTQHNQLGEYNHLILEKRLFLADFFKSFHMSTAQFDHLLKLVGPKVKKKDTKFRQSVSAAERLAIILR